MIQYRCKKELNPKVAILGCGNGGITLAADLKSRGISVALWSDKNHTSKFAYIKTKGEIILRENGYKKSIKPDLFSTELAKVINFADIIYNCTPIFAHFSIYKRLTRMMTNSQHTKLIINLSGSFAALNCFLHSTDKSIFTKLKLFDTSSFPYACRAFKNEATISGRKRNLYIAPLFPCDLPYLNLIPKQCQPSKFSIIPNSIKLGLMSTNATFHPATMLINARLIETGIQFLFYKEGANKQTSLLHDALDKERVLLARTMGYKLKSSVADDNRFYNTNFANNFEFSVKSTVHAKILSPLSLNHRYITEDIPFGLAPLLALAKLYGIKLPNIESVITIFSTIMATDFYRHGANFSGLTKRLIKTIS